MSVSADYRPNILQAKALPLAVSMLRNAQLQGSGSHTFAVLCHAARAIGNLCAGGEIAAAMQRRPRRRGRIAVLLPLLSARAAKHAEGRPPPSQVAQFRGHIAVERNSAILAQSRELRSF